MSDVSSPGRRGGRWRRWVWPLVATVWLSGCATTKNPALTPAAAVPARAVTAAAPKASSHYPAVTLTPTLMYDVLLGEIAGGQGQGAVASHYLGRAARATRDPRVAQTATRAALDARDYQAAEHASALWLASDPHALMAHEAHAESLLGLGRPEAATRDLVYVLKQLPAADLAQSYLEMAGLLVREPKTVHVLPVMQALVAVYPKHAHGYFALAQLAVARGHLALADQAIEHALTLKPAWEEGAVFKGHVLMLRGHGEQAARFYRQFLDAYPQATEVRLNYARYLVNEKDWGDAFTQFTRVANDTPDDPEAQYATGLLALQVGQFHQAVGYLRHTLELQPANQEAKINLGEAYEALKQYPDAAHWYGQAAVGSTAFSANLHLGMLAATEGHSGQALTTLKALQPATPAESQEQALAEEQVLSGGHHYHAALAAVNNALAEQPDNHELLYARALVEIKLGDLKGHEADLERIIREDPQDVEALNALGYTLTNHSTRYQTALDLIGRALKLRPGDPYIMDSLGWAYYRMGKLASARHYLEAAEKALPDPEIVAHLGEVLWMSNEHRAARALWTHSLAAHPGNRALERVMQKFTEPRKGNP